MLHLTLTKGTFSSNIPSFCSLQRLAYISHNSRWRPFPQLEPPSHSSRSLWSQDVVAGFDTGRGRCRHVCIQQALDWPAMSLSVQQVLIRDRVWVWRCRKVRELSPLHSSRKWNHLANQSTRSKRHHDASRHPYWKNTKESGTGNPGLVGRQRTRVHLPLNTAGFSGLCRDYPAPRASVETTL